MLPTPLLDGANTVLLRSCSKLGMKGSIAQAFYPKYHHLYAWN